MLNRHNKTLRPHRFRPRVQQLEDRRLLALVISEVMYNPDSTDTHWEWVEIYNNGAASVNLAGYVLDDENSDAHTAANIASGSVPAGGTAVLFNAATTSSVFRSAWGAGVNAVPVTNWGNLTLGNGGDQVSLWSSFAAYSGNHQTHTNAIDTVNYGDGSNGWPSDNGGGFSIYLRNLTADNNVGTNWVTSSAGQAGAFQSTATGGVDGNTGFDVGSPGVLPTQPGVVVIESSGDTKVSEKGDRDTYELSLNTTPTGNVTIRIAADAQAQVSLDGINFATTQTLTVNNTAPRTITVRAVDDAATEGNHTATIQHSVTASADAANYPVGMSIVPVVALVYDNDIPATNLVISEIMYDPNSLEDNWEWIEIFNRGATAINLTGYVIDDNNSDAHPAANISSGTIAARGTAVLYNADVLSAANFTAAWGAGINLVPVTGFDKMRLGNGGDRIGLWQTFTLYNGDHADHRNVSTGVDYDNSAPWPVPDGASSIYLSNVWLPNNAKRDWDESFGGSFDRSWEFFDEDGNSPPVVTNLDLSTGELEMLADQNAPVFNLFAAGIVDTHSFSDVRIRSQVFPPDIAGTTPTLGGGTANSNNDVFVIARAQPDDLSAYLLSFDFLTGNLDLVRADNGTGASLTTVSTGLDVTQAYVLELDVVGNELTGRIYDGNGSNLLFEIEATDGSYASGFSGVGAAINDDGPFQNRTILSAGFDDTESLALGANNNGAAWSLSVVGTAGARNSNVTAAPGSNTGLDIGSPGFVPNPPVAVVGRNVFYNASTYDGNNASANAADAAAIAPGKQALLPGNMASSANYISYSRGLNGLIIDLNPRTTAQSLTASDFAFRVGRNADFASWIAPPAPRTIVTNLGAGQGGADRVTIIWDDRAIANQWLEVKVLATTRTMLAAPDTFYFGSVMGESGDPANQAFVNGFDFAGARDNAGVAAITNRFDYNRDGRVDGADLAIARDNVNTVVTAPQLIEVPAALPVPMVASLTVDRRRNDQRATPRVARQETIPIPGNHRTLGASTAALPLVSTGVFDPTPIDRHVLTPRLCDRVVELLFLD